MRTREKMVTLRRCALLAAVGLALVFAIGTNVGVAGFRYPDDTFGIRTSTRTIDGLSRVLSTPTVRALLEQALQTNTIWHIVSEETNGGAQYTFFLAGHKRKSARFQTVTVLLPAGDNTPRTPTFDLAEGVETEPPAASNRYELALLRRALGDTGVLTALIEFLQLQPVRSLCVTEDPRNPSGVLLVAQAPSRDEKDLNPPRLVWRVVDDDDGEPQFVPYND